MTTQLQMPIETELDDAMLRATGPLTAGAIGRYHGRVGDTVQVIVTDPGPTGYEVGQLLGDREERWERV